MHDEVNAFTLYVTSQRSRYRIIRCTTFSWTCFEELRLSFTRKPNFSSHVYILQKLQKHMPLRGRGRLNLDKMSGKNPLLYPPSYFPTLPFWIGGSRVQKAAPALPFIPEISYFVMILAWMSDIYEFFKSITLFKNSMWKFWLLVIKLDACKRSAGKEALETSSRINSL